MGNNSGKNSIIFFVGSVFFVLLGILVITILSTRQSNTDTQDVRARAAVSAALKFTGVVNSIDDSSGTLIVDDLQFENAQEGTKSLGTWTVTPPASFNLSSVSPGSRVTISVVAETFIATSHTMEATAIVPTR